MSRLKAEVCSRCARLLPTCLLGVTAVQGYPVQTLDYPNDSAQYGVLIRQLLSGPRVPTPLFACMAVSVAKPLLTGAVWYAALSAVSPLAS